MSEDCGVATAAVESERSMDVPLIIVDTADTVLEAGVSALLRAQGYPVRHSRKAAATETIRTLDRVAARAQPNTLCIVLSDRSSDEAVAAAIEVGAVAFLLMPIAFDAIVAGVRVAAAVAREMERLRIRVDNLSHSRSLDQASRTVVGILSERYKLSPAEAYERLRRYSREERRKVGEVANDILLHRNDPDLLLERINNTVVSP